MEGTEVGAFFTSSFTIQKVEDGVQDVGAYPGSPHSNDCDYGHKFPSTEQNMFNVTAAAHEGSSDYDDEFTDG